MKKILLVLNLALLAFPRISMASGCSPSNWLGEETVVLNLGEFVTSYTCDKTCGFSVSQTLNEPPYTVESHFIHQLGDKTALPNEQLEQMETIELKIFRQHFFDACDDTFRYVLGFDQGNFRFREEMDMF
jgi:hypothetical protein